MKLTVLMIVLSGAALAKGPALCKQASPGMDARAKLTCGNAQNRALARVPGARVQSRELEEENGKLVYSFDLRVKGKPGVRRCRSMR